MSLPLPAHICSRLKLDHALVPKYRICSCAANLLSLCERIQGETRHHSPNTTPGALAHAGM